LRHAVELIEVEHFGEILGGVGGVVALEVLAYKVGASALKVEFGVTTWSRKVVNGDALSVRATRHHRPHSFLPFLERAFAHQRFGRRCGLKRGASGNRLIDDGKGRKIELAAALFAVIV
jgi:hypothetical protein